jgi:hypothetical protein
MCDRSPTDWQAAVCEINLIDTCILPSEKGKALLEAAKIIYKLFALEHPPTNDRETATLPPPPPQVPLTSSSSSDATTAAAAAQLSADDFLPIFIFCLCRSSLEDVMVTRRILSDTMISSSMMGELGYYTTMLEAAVEFIALFEPGSSSSTSPRR